MYTIQLKNVTKIFDQADIKQVIIDDCDFVFDRIKSYGIVGPSGVGKSTLLHILAGFDQDFSGSIKTIGNLVTQTPHFIKELTVYENCFLAGSIKQQDSRELKKHLEELFFVCSMQGTEHWNIGKLSGGQLQRANIIRALVTKPEFLLADEPTGSLDKATGSSIIDVLLTCKQRWNMGLIIASHNQYVIEKMDVIITLQNGKLVQM